VRSSFSFSFETYDAREGTTSVSTREGREAEEDGERGMEGVGAIVRNSFLRYIVLSI
jgi:hypothetical protein